MLMHTQRPPVVADKQKHREQVTLLFIYVTDDIIIIVKYDGVVQKTSACQIRQHYCMSERENYVFVYCIFTLLGIVRVVATAASRRSNEGVCLRLATVAVATMLA